MHQINFPEWPMFDEREEENLTQTLRSRSWWRMSGSAVTQFEQNFAKAHGVNYAIAVSNGTHAIELSLMAIGIGPGDEVIVPAYTFISTATPVFRQGGVPVAVDVDPKTLCINPEEIEKAITDKTRAIIVVHFAGHSADMDRIMEIAQTHGLRVIEDAAHAHGGTYKNKPLGSIGDIACYSFQYMKLMTSGEGGAIITNNKELYEKSWLIHNVGRHSQDREYQHSVLGSNYRISEFQAAVLSAQLERLQEQSQRRMVLAEELQRLLADVDGLTPLVHKKEATLHPFYMFTLKYDSEHFGNKSRLEFVDTLKEKGIPAFVGYSAIHQTEVWQQCGGRSLDCPIAEKAAKEMIWLHHRILLGSLGSLVEMVDYIVSLQENWQGIKA
ncbi:DegT/DnrJ/EryC1/StrS family aminotransferase [Paenibacillus sp. NPDC057934]|uniref:DegT/DnrJ/EryC1/StrS family aminotransferase n=1 Tax=Paenibacillus sp. NPDC057934 TaxID=3346282 RepID=UPI0036DDA750